MKKSLRCPLDIPEGQVGNWKIEEYEVPFSARQSFQIMTTGRGVPPGIYKRLVRVEKVGETTVMSNTPDEINDCLHFIYMAKGAVLINGLGMGMTVKLILTKPEVTKLTVIEKDEDVIKLVGNHYDDPRLEIIHADAFDYIPNYEYDIVWHDIWDNIEEDNWEGMQELRNKYEGYVKWQGCWCEDLVAEMVEETKIDEYLRRDIFGTATENPFDQGEIDEMKEKVETVLNGKPLKV